MVRRYARIPVFLKKLLLATLVRAIAPLKCNIPGSESIVNTIIIRRSSLGIARTHPACPTRNAATHPSSAARLVISQGLTVNTIDRAARSKPLEPEAVLVQGLT